MKFEAQKQNVLRALRQRNYAYVISGGLLIANAALSLKIWSHNERWVLIPQWASDLRVSLEGEAYSDGYLREWAGSVSRTLLTVNPTTVQSVSEAFLKISAIQYGQIKPYLEAHAQEIRDNDISTVFYEKEAIIRHDQSEIDVIGTFYTYFGRDKPPIIETKTFTITWARGMNGALLVSSFQEKKLS